MEANNAAKLREFAELVSHMNVDGYWNGSASICALVDKARAALAALPRNCDVGTAQEQAQRFREWCKKHDCPNCQFAKSPSAGNCALGWAQMPYEEGGRK